VLVLIASFGSVFAILLGFSRIPYAAAADGRFFRFFARLHPAGRFPSTSLLFMGALSTLACVVSLSNLISVLIVVQTMTQFAAQCVAVMVLRRRRIAANDCFRMPLFPLPAVVALLGWIYIVVSSKPLHIAIGAAMALTGTGAYLVMARSKRDWPFAGAR
jgi:amino acid transporter